MQMNALLNVGVQTSNFGKQGLGCGKCDVFMAFRFISCIDLRMFTVYFVPHRSNVFICPQFVFYMQIGNVLKN